MPNSYIPPLRNNTNIKIASNESVDYYTLYRKFNRLYDLTEYVITSATSSYVITDIPYANNALPGYVQMSSDMLSTNNNYIISNDLLSSYVMSTTLSATNEYLYNNTFNLYSGQGSLMDGLHIKYNYDIITNSNFEYNTISSQVVTGNVVFNNPYYTSIPQLSYQILDGSVNANNFIHKVTITDQSISGFNYQVYTKKLQSISTTKYPYYLSWASIGV